MEKIKLEIGKMYSPSYYAKAMGVKPPRITALKDRLNKFIAGGKWLVIHTKENEELFSNPSHARGGRK